jgi:hypothetical protein
MGYRLARTLLLFWAMTVTSLTTVNLVHSAEECRAAPGSTAPPGSRWLYRIDRTYHRHCWFLSANALSAQSNVARRHPRLTGEANKVQHNQQTESDLNTASASNEKKDDPAVVVQPPAPPSAALSPERQSSETLLARSVPVIVFRAESTNSRAPIVEREVGIIRKAPHELNIVFLAGAAVGSFFLAGGVFYLTWQRPRPQQPPDRLFFTSPPVAPTALDVTTNWAEDEAQSVHGHRHGKDPPRAEPRTSADHQLLA